MRAASFAKEWRDAAYEKGETQSFYNDFFEVFDVRLRSVARYEEHVAKLDTGRGFIDLLWPGVLIVEQKSAGRDLGKAYGQAGEYFDAHMSGNVVACGIATQRCALQRPGRCGMPIAGFGRAERWEHCYGRRSWSPATRRYWRNCSERTAWWHVPGFCSKLVSSQPDGRATRLPRHGNRSNCHWREGVIRLGDLSPKSYLRILRTTIAALTIEDRRDLILAIPAHSDRRFFGNLVGTDPDLYRALLERNVPVTARLEPLCGEPSERMIRMAREHGLPIRGDE